MERRTDGSRLTDRRTDTEAAYIVINSVKTHANQAEVFIIVFSSQDFRVDTMGKQLDTPQMRLMNRLEEPWFDFYIMCDQLAMAAALDKAAMGKTRDHRVGPF